MKIIVAGSGNTGRSVISNLVTEGHDITLIDSSEDTVTNMSNSYDISCFLGSATDKEALEEAGAQSADFVIATTEKDEMNMLCGVAAKKLGAKHIIVRVRDPQYTRQTEFLRSAMGIDTIINPDQECAAEIARILKFPSASRVDKFSRGNVEIVEYTVPSGSVLCSLKLMELSERFKTKVLITLAERGEKVFVPRGSFMPEAGDKLSLAGTQNDIKHFFKTVNAFVRPVKKVMLVGGGRLSTYLALALPDKDISVTIVEKDRSIAVAMADRVSHAEVIFGDATDSEVLSEAGIDDMDAIVSVTGDNAVNITISMFAKARGVRTIITKLSRDEYSGIVESLGMGTFVNPNEIISNQITRLVRATGNSRGGNVKTMYRLADGNAEALEFIVEEDSLCINTPLKSLRLIPNLLVAAVIRKGKSITPGGDTVILPGDRVVVVTTEKGLHDVNGIVSKS